MEDGQVIGHVEPGGVLTLEMLNRMMQAANEAPGRIPMVEVEGTKYYCVEFTGQEAREVKIIADYWAGRTKRLPRKLKARVFGKA